MSYLYGGVGQLVAGLAGWLAGWKEDAPALIRVQRVLRTTKQRIHSVGTWYRNHERQADLADKASDEVQEQRRSAGRVIPPGQSRRWRGGPTACHETRAARCSGKDCGRREEEREGSGRRLGREPRARMLQARSIASRAASLQTRIQMRGCASGLGKPSYILYTKRG